MSAVNGQDRVTQVRQILKAHGRLGKDVEALADTADLYQAGMTSHASVNVMLALESTFDVEFPDHLLTRHVFGSISSIVGTIDGLSRS